MLQAVSYERAMPSLKSLHLYSLQPLEVWTLQEWKGMKWNGKGENVSAGRLLRPPSSTPLPLVRKERETHGMTDSCICGWWCRQRAKGWLDCTCAKLSSEAIKKLRHTPRHWSHDTLRDSDYPGHVFLERPLQDASRVQHNGLEEVLYEQESHHWHIFHVSSFGKHENYFPNGILVN